MSHASIPTEKRSLPPDLVRLSIGIEDVSDLIADLSNAIQVAAEERSPPADGGFDSKFEDLPVVPTLETITRQTSPGVVETNGLHATVQPNGNHAGDGRPA